jgi:uroporphyrinogen decarboxylase
MNSRERVLAALRHRDPDRIPFDLGSTKVTGITRSAYLNLARHLGKELGTFEFYDVTQQLALMEESILRILEVDTRGLMPNVVRKSPHVEDHGDSRSFTDEWGMTWKMPKDGVLPKAN